MRRKNPGNTRKRNMPNLPKWAGADKVYERLNKINHKLCNDAYIAWYNIPAYKRPDSYTVPESVRDNIKAMNEGNEEACKACVHRHLSLVFD
jgi:hypothetical protein